MNDIDKFIIKNVNVTGNKNLTTFQKLDEESKYEISDKVVATLYKMAVEQYREIDFDEIPLTKGDFDKLKQRDLIDESLDALNTIYIKANLPLDQLNIIKSSIKTLTAYKKEFIMGFIQDVNIVQLIYNTISLSILAAISCSIDAIIDYINSGTIDSKVNYNKNYKILIDNLDKFNKASSKGELKSLFNKTLERSNFIGTAAVGIGVAALVSLGAFIVLIPIIRELIYLLYSLRMSVADYFRTQAMFLELNIEDIKNNNMKNSSVIIKKQQKIIKKLNQWANTFEVKFNKANKEVNKQLTKKIEPEEISGFSLI